MIKIELQLKLLYSVIGIEFLIKLNLIETLLVNFDWWMDQSNNKVVALYENGKSLL